MQVAGDAEVHDHDTPRERQHDVLGLEVAVNQPGGVDRLETRQQLRGNLARPTDVQRPSLPQELGQRGAVHELHRHHLVAVLDDQIEHAADVRRDDLACGAHLAPQQLARAIVSNQLRSKRLERHLHAEFEIEGVPHLPLPAATQQPQQTIAPTEDQRWLEADASADAPP